MLGDKYRRKIMSRMFLLLMLVIGTPVTALAYGDGDTKAAGATMGVTMAVSSLVMIGDIEDVSDSRVTGNQFGYKLYLIREDQLVEGAFPKKNRNRERGQLQLKDGEKAIMIECHRVVTSTSTGEAGDLAMSVTNTVTAIVGDSYRVQALNFLEENGGRKFIVLYKHCEDGILWMEGTPCKPMVLSSFNRQNDKDASALTLTFTSNSYTQPAKYTGTLNRIEPVRIPADSATIGIVPGVDEYIISEGTSGGTPITGVTGITEADYGRNIVLRGDGTDNSATVEDGSVFILTGGATWMASKGSILCMQIVDASRLVEITGTRVQN